MTEFKTEKETEIKERASNHGENSDKDWLGGGVMRKPNMLRMSETVQEIMHVILKQALGFRCLSWITPTLASVALTLREWCKSR